MFVFVFFFIALGLPEHSNGYEKSDNPSTIEPNHDGNLEERGVWKMMYDWVASYLGGKVALKEQESSETDVTAIAEIEGPETREIKNQGFKEVRVYKDGKVRAIFSDQPGDRFRVFNVKFLGKEAEKSRYKGKLYRSTVEFTVPSSVRVDQTVTEEPKLRVIGKTDQKQKSM